MKKIIAALALSLSLSACYPLIQDHPCKSEDACQAQRAAALAILSGGGFQTPAPQPYRLSVTPMAPLGPVYNVQIVP